METSQNVSFLLLSLSLIFLFLNLSETAIACHPNDKRALLEIKAHLGGENASPFSNWNPKTDCCRWNNVGCDHQGAGRVNFGLNGAFLVINNADDVVGQLPPVVGDLPYLISLRFLYLPNLIGPIPTTIAKLTNLQVLEFGSNNMDGPIPDMFENLKNLESVSLYSNKFSGSIPSSLSLLPKLKQLDLFG
ncbi:Polygalacturonase inhibitor 1 [Bienertia sinuspersici]